VLNIGANSILAEDGTYVLTELEEFIDWEVSGLIAPTIKIQPRSLSTTTLVPVTFEITATGSEPLIYQWKINGIDVLGETSRTYTVTNPTKDITGITCVVSNLVRSVASNSVNLTVGIKPTITTQPVDQTVTTGSSVTFSVVAAGSSPLSYQWNKDGVAITGATSNIFTINPASLTDNGVYSCIVSNSFGSVVSNNARLTSNLIISADTNNFVLKDALISKGWDITLPVVVNVIVNSGVTVGSNSSTLPAFKVDSFPTGSIINLTNNGTIQGAGGNGGIGGTGSTNDGELGKNGGDCLKILNVINITNNGSIWSGGGGGNGGGGISGSGIDYKSPDGGGGAGTISGIPNGTKLSGGVGEKLTVGSGFIKISVTSGNGGGPGQNGTDDISSVTTVSSSTGGSAGYYIDGNSFVKWSKLGDVKGNVK
jgi:hypothetical protein